MTLVLTTDSSLEYCVETFSIGGTISPASVGNHP